MSSFLSSNLTLRNVVHALPSYMDWQVVGLARYYGNGFGVFLIRKYPALSGYGTIKTIIIRKGEVSHTHAKNFFRRYLRNNIV